MRRPWCGRPARATALCIALLAVSACQSERHPPSPPTPEPDEAWWEVDNQTGQELVELNLIESPVVGEAWGPNQLPDETTLPDSELFRLRQVPCPGTYDQRAVGASGGFAYQYDVEFACEDIVTWALEALE